MARMRFEMPMRSQASSIGITCPEAARWTTSFVLPAEPWATAYQVAVHSGFDGEFPPVDHVLLAGSTLHLPGRSVALLRAAVPHAEDTPKTQDDEAAAGSGDAGKTLPAGADPGAELSDDEVGAVLGDQLDKVQG